MHKEPAMTQPTDPSVIADGLSMGERSAILHGDCIYGGDKCLCKSRHRDRLSKMGLFRPDPSYGSASLSPLGLHVRALITGELK